jgi:hypothetical protein
MGIQIKIRVDDIPWELFTKGSLIQGQPSTHGLNINLNTCIFDGVCDVGWITTAVDLQG